MSNDTTSADLAAEDLRVGLAADFVRTIEAEDLAAFGLLSGDLNPLHVDADVAADSQFGGQVTHGAFLVAMVSALVGMKLPGRRVLVTGFNARFGSPVRVPETLRVSGTIVAWNTSLQSGRLAARVQRATDGEHFAEVGVSFTMQQAKSAGVQAVDKRVLARGVGTQPRLLVTGGGGGLGRDLVKSLAEDFEVITVGRQAPTGATSHISLDLLSDDWELALEETLPGPLYGALHVAWPGAPRGGLMSSSKEMRRQQLSFGTDVLIGLAQILSRRIEPQGGRLIAIGSQVAHTRNVRLGAYVLGKSALETTMSLLAKELAPLRIACNVISPGFMPVGINSKSSNREQLQEKAGVPMGRLCATTDVVAAVRYLLGEGAEFHTGRVLALWGGQE